MVRKLALICFLLTSFWAKDLLEVSAEKIHSNQENGLTTISGNVVIKKGLDILKAQKVVIKTDSKRNPTFYDASGNVSFRVTLEDKRVMNGEAQKVTYDAIKNEYRLKGKSWIKEEGKKNTIRGEEIVFNPVNGYASVVGDKKKPAKITFTLEKGKNGK